MMKDNLHYTNWFETQLSSMIVGLMGYGLVMVIQSWIQHGFSTNHMIGVLIFSTIVFLLTQLVLLSIVRMEVWDHTITFIRPFQYLTWKRNWSNTISLTNDSWNELYIFATKSSARLFFRQDNYAVLFVSLDGYSSYIRILKKAFPDKKIQSRDPFDFPKKVFKQVKKEFPERVFR